MDNFIKFLLISFTIHAGLFFGSPYFNSSIQVEGLEIQLAPGFQSMPIHITDVEIIEPEETIVLDEAIDEFDFTEYIKKPEKKGSSIPKYSIGAQSSLNKGLPNPVPEYPAIAVRWGWEGAVYLRFKILQSGHVDEVKIIKSSGYPIMDNAAKTTVERWEFPKQKSTRYEKIQFEFKINK